MKGPFHWDTQTCTYTYNWEFPVVNFIDSQTQKKSLNLLKILLLWYADLKWRSKFSIVEPCSFCVPYPLHSCLPPPIHKNFKCLRLFPGICILWGLYICIQFWIHNIAFEIQPVFNLFLRFWEFWKDKLSSKLITSVSYLKSAFPQIISTIQFNRTQWIMKEM